jgi:hypothetical protein
MGLKLFVYLLCLVPAESVGLECTAPDGFKFICVTPLATVASLDKFEGAGSSGGGNGTRLGFGVRAASSVTQYRC